MTADCPEKLDYLADCGSSAHGEEMRKYMITAVIRAFKVIGSTAQLSAYAVRPGSATWARWMIVAMSAALVDFPILLSHK